MGALDILLKLLSGTKISDEELQDIDRDPASIKKPLKKSSGTTYVEDSPKKSRTVYTGKAQKMPVENITASPLYEAPRTAEVISGKPLSSAPERSVKTNIEATPLQQGEFLRYTEGTPSDDVGEASRQNLDASLKGLSGDVAIIDQEANKAKEEATRIRAAQSGLAQKSLKMMNAPRLPSPYASELLESQDALKALMAEPDKVTDGNLWADAIQSLGPALAGALIGGQAGYMAGGKASEEGSKRVYEARKTKEEQKEKRLAKRKDDILGAYKVIANLETSFQEQLNEKEKGLREDIRIQKSILDSIADKNSEEYKLTYGSLKDLMGQFYNLRQKSVESITENEQKILDRDLKSSESQKDRELKSGEGLKERDFKGSESQKSRDFKAQESAKERALRLQLEKLKEKGKSTRAASRGAEIPFDKKVQIGNLAKKTADISIVHNQLQEGLNKISDPKVSYDEKIKVGQELLKAINSPINQDAVGMEESKRLGSFLEFKMGNLTGPGSFVGRDIDLFKKQLKNNVDRLRGIMKTSESAIENLKGGGTITGTLEDKQKNVQLTEKDMKAIEWAKQNRKDPRAVRILNKHGVK